MQRTNCWSNFIILFISIILPLAFISSYNLKQQERKICCIKTVHNLDTPEFTMFSGIVLYIFLLRI